MLTRPLLPPLLRQVLSPISSIVYEFVTFCRGTLPYVALDWQGTKPIPVYSEATAFDVPPLSEKLFPSSFSNAALQMGQRYSWIDLTAGPMAYGPHGRCSCTI